MQQRVAELLAEREALTVQATTKALRSAELDAEWVLARLMEVVERCMQATPVRAPGSDASIESRWTFDAKGASRALELLGRKLRLWSQTGQEPRDLSAFMELLAGQTPTDKVYDA